MDFSSFSDENFHSKTWVNKAIKASASSGDNLDAHLSSLIMKLQLLSQEVCSSFEETSAQVLVRMPRAMMEVERLTKEAKATKQNFNQILQGELPESQNLTRKSVERMSQFHEVKQNLEHCQAVLAHAVFLSRSVKSLALTFKQGDPAQIATELSAMQTALKHLQDYPQEYTKFLTLINQFESRLVQLVASDCLTALLKREIATAQQRLAILQKIGKEDDVITSFIQKTTGAIQDMWKSFDSVQTNSSSSSDGKEGIVATSFVQWIPTFYGEIPKHFASEKKYYLEVFGASHFAKVGVYLFVGIFKSLIPPFTTRLTSLPYLDLLQVYQHTFLLHTFCKNEILLPLAATSPSAAATTTTAASTPSAVPTASELATYRKLMEETLYAPFVPSQLIYDNLEQAYLLSCLHKMSWVERVLLEKNQPESSLASSSSLLTPAFVYYLAEGTSQLFVLVEEALQRCLEFTHGLGSVGLITVINEVFVEFSNLCNYLIQRHNTDRNSTSMALLSRTTAPPTDTSTLKVGLHFHFICTTMIEKLEKFEGIVRSQILTRRSVLKAAEGPSSILLAKLPPNKIDSLVAFFTTLENISRPTLFTISLKHIQLLQKDIELMVFQALFEPIKFWLGDFAKFEVWSRGIGEEEMTVVEHPLEYIRSIGDYLLDLPMVINAQAPGKMVSESSSGDDELGERSRYWIDLVIRGTVDMLIHSMEAITTLTKVGADQLATDIDYFKNILTLLTETSYPIFTDIIPLLQCDPSEFVLYLAKVEVTEKMSFYKSLRVKRTSSSSSSSTFVTVTPGATTE